MSPYSNPQLQVSENYSCVYFAIKHLQISMFNPFTTEARFYVLKHLQISIFKHAFLSQ